MKRNATLCLTFLALLVLGGCPLGAPLLTEGDPRVRISTTQGEFLIELHEQQAPLTVENFRQYVEDGFYDGVIFHRVVPDFVAQTGGYLPGLVEKTARDPVINESDNGLVNARSMVAMARTTDPDSATSQFYVNVVDNPALDANTWEPGYTVFGRVIEGMDIVDQIAAAATEAVDGFTDVPVEDIIILSATLEPGPQQLSTGADAYLQGVEYNVEVMLRDLLVEALGWVIGR